MNTSGDFSVSDRLLIPETKEYIETGDYAPSITLGVKTELFCR